MRAPIADSGGRPLAIFREFNTCHNPPGPGGGRFCSTKGEAPTAVGITSARPGKAPGDVSRQRREFTAALSALPGVSHVRVQPGIGQWDGGWEPSWVVSYYGNGAARRLLAQTAKAYDQDAVLVLKPCRGRDCDPVVDLTTTAKVSKRAMDALAPVLTAAGLGGWTWFRRDGVTHLRMASVPAWGGETQAHLNATRRVRRLLRAAGIRTKMRVRTVKAEAIGRERYDEVVRGAS